MHTGILEIDYKGSVKRIEYSLQLGSYGGLPLLIIQDKNKHHYPFVRGTHNGWHSLTKEPNWPRDFLDILYYAMEEKYQEIGS